MPVVKTIEQLRQELEAKVLELAKLTAYRDKLQAELDAVDRRVALIQGSAAPVAKRRGRPGRKPKAAKVEAAPKAPKAEKAEKKIKGRRGRRAKGGNLVDVIKQVLSGKSDGMRIRDIATAVKDAGYKSAAKDFYTIVATAMREPGAFTKTGRGVYKLA